MARIAFHLRHPVANRLGRRLELLREIVGTTPCAHQLHHSAPVFRRIPCMTLGHRGSPSLSPLRHCPPNRVNSSSRLRAPENCTGHATRKTKVSSRSRWQQETCDGLLGEYGIIAPHGIAHLRRLLSELLADPEGSGLSGLLGESLVEIAGRLRFFDERIRTYDLRIGRVFSDDERCQRLAKVEGVGLTGGLGLGSHSTFSRFA